MREADTARARRGRRHAEANLQQQRAAIGILAAVTTNETRDYAKLARLVRLRKAELELTLHGLAEKAGKSQDQVKKAEQGADAGEHIYIALDRALEWPAGTCVSILEHANTTINEHTGAPNKPITEEDISQALLAAIVANADLDTPQIRAVRDAFIGDLKRRGLL